MAPVKGLPVLDAHLHLDPEGAPKEAVKKFRKAGGTHLIVVHKPYRSIGISSLDDYMKSFQTTIRMTELARSEGVGAWCVLGPYPGEIPGLVEKLGPAEAQELQIEAVDTAVGLVEEGKALGIGEIGRIHFRTTQDLMEICDGVLSHALHRCASIDCPVVLHTESFRSNPSLMEHLATMADDAGIPRVRMIKHYSGPDLIPKEMNKGISISLQCRRASLKTAIPSGEDFLLETDYIDDSSRPNVVMPPDTVPKKIEWAYGQGLLDSETHHRLMVDTPLRTMDLDTIG